MAGPNRHAGFDVIPRIFGTAMSSWSGKRGDAPGIPILLYHRVSGDPVPGLEHYCVSPASFREQMEWLKSRGYQSVSLSELVDRYKAGVPAPARQVVITFDDGYRDNLDNAYPVLETIGFSAVIFLVAGAIGQTAAWDAAFGPPPGLLSWPEIRSMANGLISFGAHTVNHLHLCQLSPLGAREEICRARELIQDGLGQEVSSFAYPYSDFSVQLRDYVAGAGYNAACSSIWGLSTPADDVYALRRLIVGGGDSLETFARRIRGNSRSRSSLAVRPVLQKIKGLVTRGPRSLAGGG